MTLALVPTRSSNKFASINKYFFQVIAREDKGLLGVDYNRSPHVHFTLKRRYQKQQQPPSPVKEVEVEEVDSNKVEKDDGGDGVITRSDEGVTSQSGQDDPDVKNESGLVTMNFHFLLLLFQAPVLKPSQLAPDFVLVSL